MSRNLKKKKKSTSKYRSFKTLPLIPIVAIIEVLVLIGVSTYAWFYLSTNKTAQIGTISVDADSGLDIDFKYAKKEDYINIWNYIDKDFTFEPVTSLDGRNMFIPTSGTFNSNDTTNMVFRDGTVNDINSKYINIDFELTNTTDANMEVYLNNNSYFHVLNGNQVDESRALRLAFYPNDTKVGNVTSNLIGGTADYTGIEEQQIDPAKVKTVYFDNTTPNSNPMTKNWEKVYVYLWRSSDNTYQTAWPGIEMSRSTGPIYAYSFTEDDVVYDKVIFNNGNGTKTGDLNFSNNYVYQSDGSKTAYTANTVYFVKPNNWNTDNDGDNIADVYVHAWRGTDNNPSYYTTWSTSGDVSGLDKMKYEGSGIYSYTYKGGANGAARMLFTNGSFGQNNQTVNFTPSNGKIYYISGKDSTDDYKYTVTTYSKDYTDPTFKYNTVYFYNSLGWTNPHMVGATNPNYDNKNTIDLAMTSLTSNVYYCMVPEVYTSVYFRDKNDASKRSSLVNPVQDGYVYRTKNERDTNQYWKLDSFQYNEYTSSEGYAVISPGVSAGFQRTYTPVVSIDHTSGAATQVIPAFSNSIDNYIYGNQAGPLDANNEPTSQTVFDIPSKSMLSLSMVIWLEGTDPACDGSTYAGKKIEVRLEFASRYKTGETDPETGEDIYTGVNTGDARTYKYKFYDKTREVWTSDRQATESGVTVAPVMQLYDNTIGRGYLMNPDTFTEVNGKRKVSCWAVDAPQSIALQGHDIIFRRVNPYDEDEVWNYWHAGKVAGTDAQQAIITRDAYTPYEIYDVAKAGTNDTICFTAFADGSPTAEILRQNGNTNTEIADAQLPTVSCGGLWGNHNVRTLTVVDGLSGYPCKNNDGILTMSYSYKYVATNGGSRTVKIEYKASGPNNQIFYFFIVPDALYTSIDPNVNQQGLRCTFKNYYNYDDGFAINSDRNTIKYRGVYGDGNNKYRYSRIAVNSAPVGDYFMLNEWKARNTGAAKHYWGSDVMYVETTNATSDYVLTGSDKGKFLQVHYYDVNNNNNSMYSVLYAVDDGDLKGNATTVFVSVVPCGTGSTWYNHYRVEVCDWNNPSNKLYWADAQELHGGPDTISKKAYETWTGSGSKLTINRNYMQNNKNIVKLDKIETTVYLQSGYNDLKGDNQRPYAYLYKGSSNNGYPGTEMTYVSDKGNGIYEYSVSFNPLEFDTIIFNNGKTGQAQVQTNYVTLTDYSDVYVFQNGYTLYANRSYKSDDYSIIVTSFYESYNPHYGAGSVTNN